jgi:hypothetical protein
VITLESAACPDRGTGQSHADNLGLGYLAERVLWRLLLTSRATGRRIDDEHACQILLRNHLVQSPGLACCSRPDRLRFSKKERHRAFHPLSGRTLGVGAVFDWAAFPTAVWPSTIGGSEGTCPLPLNLSPRARPEQSTIFGRDREQL